MYLVIKFLSNDEEQNIGTLNKLMSDLSESVLSLTAPASGIGLSKESEPFGMVIEGIRKVDISSEEVVAKTNELLDGSCCQLAKVIVDDENTPGIKLISTSGNEKEYEISKHFIADILGSIQRDSSMGFFGHITGHVHPTTSTRELILQKGVVNVSYTCFQGKRSVNYDYSPAGAAYIPREGQVGFEYHLITNIIQADINVFKDMLQNTQGEAIHATINQGKLKLFSEQVDFFDGLDIPQDERAATASNESTLRPR